MPLVVDGMNVIGSRPDGWWRDRRGAQRALVQALGALGEPVTVVFDGAPHDVDAPDEVEVAFAPHADDEIAARAAPGVIVVTSDRELAERARAAGAEVQPAKAFRARLWWARP
ncbi:MAG: NYN domain-containing protein [Actinobacteria bacterium]|nr:MAG: NYN domain-containing protein [Actinomycetota bacterium]